MTDSNKTPTDDEIEADVVAKRNDPSAWEVLPFVPPSTAPRPMWMFRARHLELAAKFHVLYLLHYLGLEANLALSQPYGADITVLREGGHATTIDVKTVTGRGDWLPEQFTPRKHHFVVFVYFGEKLSRLDVVPQVYVAASERLHNWLSREKRTSISLQNLDHDLKARNAWSELLTEPAA